jgi:DNA-binding LytR/AlgR family response regulator
VTQHRPTALIADDEPLLRRSLTRMLASAWPELDVVAQARNGREAVQLFEADHPDVCFLDVHMPGLSGVEAARAIGRRAHLVFVTAFDRYAVQAFEQGALDYLVKPVERARLDDTVARLKERLRSAQTLPLTEELLEQLAAQLRRKTGPQPLNWIRASLGQSLRMIPVDGIEYLRSDEKYTRIAWRDEGGEPAEALVRMPLKELLAQLDATQFVQVHRSVVVNLRAVSHVTRGQNETAQVHLRGRDEVLPVSRSFLHHSGRCERGSPCQQGAPRRRSAPPAGPCHPC